MVKAILTEHDIEPPKIHDLAELATLAGLELSSGQTLLLTQLSDQAVRSRYPGAQYGEAEVRALLEQTRTLFEWLRAKLSY